MEPWKIAAAYHQRTKHYYQHYARSLGHLDWANQPDPFRRFAGADLLPLPFAQSDDSPRYDDLYEPHTIAPRPLSLHTLGLLFEYSLAISAWKEYRGTRWALRMNPSSGNLHPTEGYAILPALSELHRSPAVYHYTPRAHALERRCEFEEALWEDLIRPFPAQTFCFGLSSVHWRETWKYGERAYRYCQHDVGHALAALSLAAASLGWQVVMLQGMSDAQVAGVLGLHRADDFKEAEPEHPDLLAAVVTFGTLRHGVPEVPTKIIESIASARWHGSANRLSGEHVDWEAIRQVEAACVKGGADPAMKSNAARHLDRLVEAEASGMFLQKRAVTAHGIMRQRRSALAMDGQTSISEEEFYVMLHRVLPDPYRPPWSAMCWPVLVNLALFVHRVRGIDPGLYCLVRNPEHDSPLRGAMYASFRWEKPLRCPPSVPLYLLQACDCRELSARVSCGQTIASDGAFSLSMIAEFEQPLRTYGAWLYRRLFWETGMIGQVLYLEAEAAGIRSTGIGCFFDDPAHEVFGLRGMQFQSLYHFTVGGHVEDPRLTTLPAYDDGTR